MSREKKDIVIIGGSLAGLFASVPLVQQGHNVTILERSPTPLLHDQGAGIVAGGETQQFFKEFDRSGRGSKDLKGGIAVKSKARYYLNKEGDIIDGEEWEQRMTSWDLLFHITRWNSDGMTSNYVPSEAEGSTTEQVKALYEYGRNVTSIEDAGDKVKVNYDDVREGSSGGSGTLEADYIIIADGPSSHLRKSLIPDIHDRTYAGYVAFRGTVPEQSLSTEAAAVFIERFTFFHSADPATQILAYTIPGPGGSLEPGSRLINWVWYWNLAADSPELADTLTDVDGNAHRWTLPTGGKMQRRIWEAQKEVAARELSPQFAEIVRGTRHPFVQAITDLLPPPDGTPVGRLLGGKAAVVGDALSGFRPHTAASTSQAAYHALLLDKVFKGEMGWEEYERRVLQHAKAWQARGVMLGNRSQFGEHPLAQQAAKGQEAKKVDRKDLWMIRGVAKGLDHNE